MTEIEFKNQFNDFVAANLSDINARIIEGGITKDIVAELGKHGVLSCRISKQYGGSDISATDFGRVTEVLSKYSQGLRNLLTVHSTILCETIQRFGSEEQKEKYLRAFACGDQIGAFALSEPDAGSDAFSLKTSYIKSGDYYVLSGNKKWITLGNIADIFLVIAKGEGDQPSAFLVERGQEGVTSSKIDELKIAGGSHIANVTFKNVRVHESNLILKEGLGFNFVTSSALDSGRFSIAFASLGIAQKALELMVAYSRSRSQFGKKLREFQTIRGMIADSTTQLEAARALCYEAANLRDQGAPDSIMKVNLAKYFSSKVAVQITNASLQVHGGVGFTSDYEIFDLNNEAKVLEVIEGSSQIQQELISTYALNRYKPFKSVSTVL